MELKIRSTAFSWIDNDDTDDSDDMYDSDDTYDNETNDTLSQALRRNSCNENDDNLQQLY